MFKIRNFRSRFVVASALRCLCHPKQFTCTTFKHLPLPSKFITMIRRNGRAREKSFFGDLLANTVLTAKHLQLLYVVQEVSIEK